MRGATPCDDARAVLQARGYKVRRVVAVHPDAVLWLDIGGNPRTSFVALERVGETSTRLVMGDPLPGFVA